MLFKKISIVSLALGLLSGCASAAPAKLFIGTWGQPCESADKWKADLGPNVIFFNPDKGTQTQEATHALCKQKQVRVVDSPATPADLTRMLADSNVVFINLGDEPSLHSPSYNVDPVGFKTFVANWMTKFKWIADGARGKKPLFLNHAGPKIGAGLPTVGYQGQNEAPYSALTGPGDYLGHDWHVKNMQGITGRYPNDYVGQALKKENTWWPGRNPFVFLEACDQVLDGTVTLGDPKNLGRGPTAVEMEEQLQSALAQNAQGIIFFTHAFKFCGWDRLGAAGKTCWDMRTPELVAKTKEMAAKYGDAPTPTPAPTADPALIAKIATLESKVAELQSVILKVRDAIK